MYTRCGWVVFRTDDDGVYSTRVPYREIHDSVFSWRYDHPTVGVHVGFGYDERPCGDHREYEKRHPHPLHDTR